jgi:uncharacterized protein YjeT (DUF2065 family)
MDNENNKDTRLRQVGGALIVLGAALVSRLPQLLPGQVAVPWYQQNFLLAGIVLAFIGLLLLAVPSKAWRTLWSKISPWAINRRRKERQREQQKRQREQEQQELLRRSLPTYVIQGPAINPQPINPKEGFPQYAGKFKIVITNQPDCIEPVDVHFNARMVLKQKWGYANLSMTFTMQPKLPNAAIPLRETCEYDIDMLGYPDGTGLPYLDLNKCYHWAIQGVTLQITGLQERVECYSEGYISGEGKG